MPFRDGNVLRCILNPGRLLTATPQPKNSTFLSFNVFRKDYGSPPSVALLILNVPIPDFRLLEAAWAQSKVRICADGGANRLFYAVTGSESSNEDGHVNHETSEGADPKLDLFLPDCIIGDLDSIEPTIQAFYASKGVSIIDQSADQDSTDFGKALRWLVESRIPSTPSIPSTPQELNPDSEFTDIIVFGGVSGRVDQGYSQIHQMYRDTLSVSDRSIWLISEESLSIIIPPGITAMEIPRRMTKPDPLPGLRLGRHTGILPIFGPATITTTGFKWDVDNWRTEIGHNVSTSNLIEQPIIHITTDHHVLFTIEWKDDKIGTGTVKSKRRKRV